MFTHLSNIWCKFYRNLYLHNCYLIVLLSTFKKKKNLQTRELFEFMNHIFITNSHILHKILFKASIINAQENLTVFTSCLFFSAVHCLHLPHLVCFTDQWALFSLWKLDIAFLFWDPRNDPINLLQSSILNWTGFL